MRDSIKRQLRSGKLLFGGHPSKSLQYVPYAQIPRDVPHFLRTPLRMAGIFNWGGGGRIFSSKKPTKLVHLRKLFQRRRQKFEGSESSDLWGTAGDGEGCG